MTRIMFFDTETTGVNVKDDYTVKGQSAPVQLYAGIWEEPEDLNEWFTIKEGAVIISPNLQPIAELRTYVQLPDGMQVEQGAVDIHGITAEKANSLGMSRLNVACAFMDMLDVADKVVAHNIAYDRKIMNHMIWMETEELDEAPMGSGIFSGKDLACTMKDLTNVVKVPKPSSWKGSGFKWPKLSECYKYFFGREFEDAHDAAVDTKACAEVYFVNEFFKERMRLKNVAGSQ